MERITCTSPAANKPSTEVFAVPFTYSNQKAIRKQKNQNNSKSKLGKRENHEKETFGSWLTAAPVCFQTPRTALATSVAVSFGVWCGGGLEKQRTAQP